MATFSVKLSTLIQKFNLEAVNMPQNPEELLITTPDINRPGLYLAGHHDLSLIHILQLFFG